MISYTTQSFCIALFRTILDSSFSLVIGWFLSMASGDCFGQSATKVFRVRLIFLDGVFPSMVFRRFLWLVSQKGPFNDFSLDDLS